MTFQEILQGEVAANLVAEARIIAQTPGHNLIWNDGVEIILTIAIQNPDLAPNLKAATRAGLIQKWLQKYANGFNNRISVRNSNPPGTTLDPILETIIGRRLPNLTPDDLVCISYGHRLSMSAENILGLLLEEYLSDTLFEFGWHCCWGETMRSVDFVQGDGRLLQVKNRSNSENSSSSRVRLGTEINKWFRINAITGLYQWDELNEMHQTHEFSEDNFREFVLQTLTNNPAALPVENNNPWGN